MSLLAFCEWLAATPGSVALHESLYMYPLLESAHVLTLMLFVGCAVMLDLRLLGLTLRSVPVSEVLARLLPYTLAGFAVMVVTGALLFYAIPVRTYQSIFFRIKVLLLLAAALNVWRFHRKVQRSIAEWDTAAVAPPGARFAAAASLGLWFGVIVAGRMIAYNWFDCDLQPQSAFVNWAAGCVVPASATPPEAGAIPPTIPMVTSPGAPMATPGATPPSGTMATPPGARASAPAASPASTPRQQ